MIQNPDRPLIAAGDDRFDKVDFQVAVANWQNLFARFVACLDHPIKVQAIEVGDHGLQQFGETIEVIVAMMHVVDDADVRAVERLDDFDLILGFAKPSAVVI